MTIDDDQLLLAFVRESNRIEGIVRPPRSAELRAHRTLLHLPAIDVPQLKDFVWQIAPGKPIREKPGMDVRVGLHIPPPGGPAIIGQLETILARVNVGLDPFDVHCAYEMLHPFMDGNGRSGRALWLWMMLRQGRDPFALARGFLHTWYYQSLSGHQEHTYGEPQS